MTYGDPADAHPAARRDRPAGEPTDPLCRTCGQPAAMRCWHGPHVEAVCARCGPTGRWVRQTEHQRSLTGPRPEPAEGAQGEMFA
jgi:hypothetical protein